MRCRGRSILLRGVVVAVLGLGFAVAESGSLAANGAEAVTATATGVEGMTPIDPIRIFETRAGLPGFVGRGALAAGHAHVHPWDWVLTILSSL